MVSKTQAVRQLSFARRTQEHIEEYYRQTAHDASDRSATLLLVADLEAELTSAIEARLGALTDAHKHELYSQDGPLSSFARKITMADVLGIIGPVAKSNMRIIRHIRNAFAHSQLPLTFDTPEIRDLCNDMDVINPVGNKVSNHHKDTYASTREFFEDQIISMAVLLYSFASVYERDSEARSLP